MRIGRFLIGLGLGSLVLAVMVGTPGCSSAVNVDSGPSLKDAPPPAPGQMTSEEFNKNRKKK